MKLQTLIITLVLAGAAGAAAVWALGAAGSSKQASAPCEVVSKRVIQETLALPRLDSPVVQRSGTLCIYYAGSSPVSVSIGRQRATLAEFSRDDATAVRRSQEIHSLPPSFGPHAFYTVASSGRLRAYSLTVYRRPWLVGVSAGQVSLSRLENLMTKVLAAR